MTAVLTVDGLHVPVMPLVEDIGSAGDAAFWQSGPSCAKVGVAGAFTTIFIVAVVPPAVGVKVYVVVPAAAVLIVAGLQVPAIPFVDVAGSAGGVAF